MLISHSLYKAIGLFFLFFGLFNRLYFMLTAEATESDPQWAGNEDRGIAAGEEAHIQCESEILGSLTTEPVEGAGSEKTGNNSIEGPGESLVNAAVCQLLHIAAPAEMDAEILSDTVENNDGIVDGETGHG